jgi:hypothetical protein
MYTLKSISSLNFKNSYVNDTVNKSNTVNRFQYNKSSIINYFFLI